MSIRLSHSWVTVEYLRMRLKGIPVTIDQGMATVATAIGNIQVPFSALKEEPEYKNEELEAKLKANRSTGTWAIASK